ncbi:MAG: glycosyltransferase family 4 protein [Microcoleaceae cyanobacterium]
MPGGLNRYVYELIHCLAKDQDQVELCGVGLPQSSPDSVIKLTNLAEPDTNLPNRLWLAYKNFSQRQIQYPSAINLHFALYDLPLLPLLPKDTPITFTFHGPWSLESQEEGANSLGVWVKYWIEQQVYQRCDRFIVLSKAFGEILNQHYHVAWDKIHVIPGGVDTTRFMVDQSRQQAREQLGWPQDRLILFTPRRLVNRMGIDVLLNALVTVKTAVPEVWLAIAGKGALRETLERQSIELGLEHQVEFLGYLPDESLPVAYQAADLTVVPSQALEGFGLIVLESLASGTPVFCTPVGGMPEILQPFSPELVTDAIDAQAIATRLVSVLTGQIGLPDRTICREYAVNHFNWPDIAHRVREVLLAA